MIETLRSAAVDICIADGGIKRSSATYLDRQRNGNPTGSALFHYLASLFSLDVHSAIPYRKDNPVEVIRQLRAKGYSVAEIAKRTGASDSQVRRIVGKLDPAEKERRRRKQIEIATRINARPEPWHEKVERWKAETGQCEATFRRVLCRVENGE